MIDEIRHKNYHDNPAYHFEKEKSTAKILNYELDKNSDIEYQIIDDEATRWLYGTLMALLIIIIINLFVL
jgi:hypothetical protein